MSHDYNKGQVLFALYLFYKIYLPYTIQGNIHFQTIILTIGLLRFWKTKWFNIASIYFLQLFDEYIETHNYISLYSTLVKINTILRYYTQQTLIIFKQYEIGTIIIIMTQTFNKLIQFRQRLTHIPQSQLQVILVKCLLHGSITL